MSTPSLASLNGTTEILNASRRNRLATVLSQMLDGLTREDRDLQHRQWRADKNRHTNAMRRARRELL